jgi:isocitrate lyase
MQPICRTDTVRTVLVHDDDDDDDDSYILSLYMTMMMMMIVCLLIDHKTLFFLKTSNCQSLMQ